VKSESRSNINDVNNDELNTTKSKESDEDEKPLKSKYLHKFSLYKYGYIKYFLMEMNYIAREEFKCIGTFFDSPHGLANRWNTSTAADLAKISAMAMKNYNF